MTSFTDLEFEEFFEALRELRGIANIDKHLLSLLFDFQPDLSPNVKKFLALSFSLLDDGNTRVPLDAEKFLAMWTKKWDGLVQLNISISESELEETQFHRASDFQGIILEGISEILKMNFTEIIENRKSKEIRENDSFSKPLVIFKEDVPYLYFAKHFNAKCIIEDSASRLFKDGSAPSKNEIETCIEEISKIHNPVGEEKKKFLLNDEQATAILRGIKQNLVITGGPGTGKTTVVLYILWKLLEAQPKMLEWNIYLAAPSGKAADRMRESLAGNLNDTNDSIKESETGNKIFNKLASLESSTIHRLLKFSPITGEFRYNKKEQFPENSIFVIDEASMIDIEMFAALLQAIPDSAKLFILGDPFQLPSVDSGAVLGEILKTKNSQKDFTVRLKKSKRFTDDSSIGHLAQEIKDVAESNDPQKFRHHDFLRHPVFSTTDTAASNANVQTKDLVSYYSIEETEKLSKKEEEKRIERIVRNWARNLKRLPELAQQIHPGKATGETEIRDQIWELSLTYRMLSAERRGNRGVGNLNKKACSELRQEWMRTLKKVESNPSEDHINTIQDSGYFPGQLLIITKNQEMFKLYNGDTGIVIFDGYTPYLMLKKAPPQDSHILRDGYVFYPLAVLPEDSIESAFAITIHKSQGSEYENITMFLPKQKGHPLLTNQIIYTGITRAKKSVTIIATEETFKAACTTVTERETGILL